MEDEWPSPDDFRPRILVIGQRNNDMRERFTFPPEDPRHGTTNGYVNLRCRCDDCREAWRTYEPAKVRREAWRRRRGMQPRKVGRTHGIRATYTHGCRCPECRAAERAYMTAYRQRRAENGS